MKRILIALTLLSVGCTPRPKPAPKPAPPAIQKPARPAPLKQGDIPTKHCQLAKQYENGYVDCICRHASTHIDANDTSKQMMVCR